MTRSDRPGQLKSLRTLRRRRRSTRRLDRLYRSYVTTLLGSFACYLAIGVLDEARPTPATIDAIVAEGPRWVSLATAALIAGGIRSGLAGGPLLASPMDLQHVYLAPLGRAQVVAGPLGRLIAWSVTIGVVLGAAVGEIGSRQLPGRGILWVVGFALAGAAGVMSALAAALLSTRITHRWIANLVAATLVGWAAVEVTLGSAASPTYVVGQLAFVATEGWAPRLTLPLIVAPVLLALGWKNRGFVSLERARRRGRQVALFKFALSQQDLRTLLLLRREMSLEEPRGRPWVRLPKALQLGARAPVLLRDLRSYLRWPAARVARFLLLGLLAGAGLAAVWSGASVALAGAGLAAYLAALETIEPLSQELDHPTLLELAPLGRGAVIAWHIAGALLALLPLYLPIGLIATALSSDPRLGISLLVAAIPSAGAAVAAAGVTSRGPGEGGTFMPEEAQGLRLLIRLAWPPALATIGFLPVLVARNATLSGAAPVPAMLDAALAVSAVAAAVMVWIRARADVEQLLTASQGTK